VTLPPFEIDRSLYPFTSRFMELGDGTTLHYIDEGEGSPALVFLHGNPTWSFLYRRLIAGLAPDHRCIAVDYPGFGLSTPAPGFDFTAAEQARVVAEFVERLGLRRVVFVMQDWGGPIGLALAADRPEVVSGVVLGNTWAWPLAGDRRLAFFSRIMGGPIGRTAARAVNGVWRFFMARGFAHPPTAEILAMYAAPFANGGRIQTAIFPRELIAAVELERKAERGLHAMGDRPALLLWGSRDFGFRDAERSRFERALPDHRTVLLDAGHFWPEDQPDVAVRSIRRWMADRLSGPEPSQMPQDVDP